MKILAAIALGGAVGALARHFTAQQMAHWLGSGYPWGTFTVNVVGSFILGVLAETFALSLSMSLEMRGFLIVGILGSFTTFSTFSLDTVLLFQRGRADLGALYIAASVACALIGMVAGLRLTRAIIG